MRSHLPFGLPSPLAACAAALAFAGATALAQDATPTRRVVQAHGKNQPYKPQPTRTLEDLAGLAPTPMPERTEFGGVKRYPPSRATGFFRTERIGGRWWLIDPTGHRMINAGVTSTTIGKLSPAGQEAFDKTYGDPQAWARQTGELIRTHGFDGTGCWSDDATLRAAVSPPLVHARYLPFMGNYGKQRGGTHDEPGHTGYPNRCTFVFDTEFAASADATAKAAAQHKDDPYLLGYFTDNELPFPIDALDRYLALPDADAGRKAAEAFVAERNAKRDALTDDDRQAFMAILGDRYFATVSAALRRHDPNHLILGPRFHSTDHRNVALLATAAKHIDVVGYNLYNVWTPRAELMDRLSIGGTVPVLISEFYAKGDDAGLTNVDGAGWAVRTQADRGAFYQNFTLALLESKVAVGWHWFRYQDNDPAVPRGANKNDSNKGMVGNRYQPHVPLLDAMRQLNASRYAAVDYFDQTAEPGRPRN